MWHHRGCSNYEYKIGTTSDCEDLAQLELPCSGKRLNKSGT